jgi:hypothetical protein
MCVEGRMWNAEEMLNEWQMRKKVKLQRQQRIITKYFNTISIFYLCLCS